MFTGIITDIGRIERVERRGDLRARVATGYDTGTIELGASIACSGVCLTVVDKGPDWFEVDISGETLARSAGSWKPGAALNLERALKVGDELGGHIVTGHVDGIGEIAAAHGDGASTRITVEAGPEIAPYIVEKGSIALDGVSLTVNEAETMPGGFVRFGINIIPHTAASTNFGEAGEGRAVNIEVDILARYLGRLMESRASTV